MEHTKVRSPEKLLLLWLLWILANGAGGTVLGALSSEDTDVFTYPYMGGLIVGVAQWLVLWRYIPQAGWWVPASAFGWVLGFLVCGSIIVHFAPLVVLIPVVHAVLGVAQWLVLRRHTQYAGWWVLASAISGVVLQAVASPATAYHVGGRALSYGAGWAASGAVTGIMLVWLLRSES